MVGVRESIELDISRALTQVKQLEAAVSRVGNVKVGATGAQDAARDIQKVKKATDDTSASAHTLGTRFGGVSQAVAALGSAFVAAKIGQEIGKAISAASDLNESVSKSRAVFGEIGSAGIEAFGDTASSIGLSKQAAVEAAGTFGNLFTAMGQTREQAASLAPEVVKLGSDFASFNNIGTDEALEKLRSGLVGEIEPLRALGISFNAAQVEAKAMALGLADANGTVSEGAKVQARWALIVEQSSNAQGDFARTSDGLANQQRILNAEFENARAEIGQSLLPIMLKVVGTARDLISVFTELPSSMQTTILAFVGLAAALGPVLYLTSNVARGVQGLSSVMQLLSRTTGMSVLAISGWGLALAGVTVLLATYLQIQAAAARGQREMDDASAKTVNNTVLAEAGLRNYNQSLREQADALARGTMSLDEYLGAGLRETNVTDLMTKSADELTETQRRLVEQVKQGTSVLNELSKASGVTKDRIAQLATEMGINLGAATKEQREQLSAAVTEIGRAVTPTERLEAVSATLGNTFATTAEQIDAFNEALDAALGSYLNAEEATLRVIEKTDDLAAAFTKGRESGETVIQFTNRLRSETIGLTRAIVDEVDALVRDGRVSADAGVRKEEIRKRLLALASTLGGPMAAELRNHIGQLDEIATLDPTTEVKANTAQATAAIGGLPPLFATKGTESGRTFSDGVAQGITDRKNAAINAAIRLAIDTGIAARREFQAFSPSRVGMRIGGFFAEGVAIGIEEQSKLAQQAARGMALGIADEVHRAAQLTNEEQLTILNSLGAVKDAEKRLSEVRADKASSVLDIRRAELELAEAQRKVNDAIYDGADASEVIKDAYEEQREAVKRLRDDVNAALDTLGAMSGLGGAQRSLASAERERAALQQRQGALPGEIAAAEGRLTVARQKATQVTTREGLAIVRARETVRGAEEKLSKARADEKSTADDLLESELALVVAQEDLTATEEEAVGVTRDVEEAERDLAKLREEQAELADQLAEANRRVTDAISGVVQAQLRLIESGQVLQGSMAVVVDTVRKLGEAAGLTKDQIDELLISMGAADRASAGSQSALGGQNSQRLINPLTGNPAYSGPLGEAGLAAHDPRISTMSGLVRGIMPDGTPVYYVPGQNIQAGNVAAIAAVGRATAGPAPGAATYQPMNVNIYPKQAVYDAKSTVSTLRQLELLHR